MRIAKRTLSLLLSFILAWSISGANLTLALEVPAFKIGEYKGSAGDTIEVPVQVKGNPGIAAIKLKVAYDDTRLELTTVTYGNWGGSFQQPQKKTSPVSLTWYNGAENYTVADSTFATLTFHVLEGAEVGDAEISMTYEPDNVYNIDETNIKFATLNGKITVANQQICTHANTASAYADNGNKTHTVTTTCSDCGEQISTTSEGCADVTNDEKCDRCGAELKTENVPTFEIGVHEAACGNTVQVPVWVKGNPGIAAVKLRVAYDDTRLELTTVTYGSWGGSFQQPQKKTSPVSLTWYNGTENYTVVDSTFATLTFRVLEDAEAGDAEIRMTYEPDNVYNIEETNIEFAVVNGKVVVEGDALHTHTPKTAVRENEVAATCKEAGSYDEVVYCSVCGEEMSREKKTIEKLDHTEEIIPAVAATCKATGLTEGKKCSVCGEVLVAQEVVSVKGHAEEIDKAVAPSCTATGLTEGKHCDVCGKVLIAQTVVPALGHSSGSAADCSNAQNCTICGTELKAALGHDYKGVVTEPTHSDAGYTTYTCSRCGDSYIGDVVPAGGTTFVPGDANHDGKADSSDAVAILRNLAGYEVPNFYEDTADFNGDGKADSSDAVAILRKLAGY